MKLTFYGAAQQVTGSMFLLEFEDDFRLLIDCGLDLEKYRPGKERELPEPSRDRQIFPFEASLINAVVLTHAHVDHSGNLPNLVREGFDGPVFCTPATAQLVQILLYDTAGLHESKLKKIADARRKGKAAKYAHIDTAEMYTTRHVRKALELLKKVEPGPLNRLTKNINIQFNTTGHLLGAANVLLAYSNKGVSKSIGFSGDIGRHNYPLLPNPDPLPAVDYLVCETTYGNRCHQSTGLPKDFMARVIKEACVDKPGRLIIPAFSVGRTQAILYTLNQVFAEGLVRTVPVYSDSPLALQSTMIYANNLKYLNADAQNFAQNNGALFDFENLTIVKDSKESRALNDHTEPLILISSSGMISGGRIDYHVRKNIENPFCTFMLVGYAAEGTPGHDILMGQPNVKLANKLYAIRAKIERTDLFSGHGDQNDLVNFVKQQNNQHLEKVFLVHGELESMTAFANKLNQEGYNNVEIPEKAQTYQL